MPALFVYGSLKRGLSNHARLGDDARFVGADATSPSYRLVDYGGYPALIPDGRRAVVGEVWEVTDERIRELDEFECVDVGLYRRDTIALDSGRRAEVYVYAREVTGLPDCGDRWLEGHPYWDEGWRFFDAGKASQT